MLFVFTSTRRPSRSTLFPYTTLFRSTPTSSSTTPTLPVSSRPTPTSSWARPTGGHGWVAPGPAHAWRDRRSEEHTSELQSHSDLVCRLLLEKKKKQNQIQKFLI